jgi:hypothetical protein
MAKYDGRIKAIEKRIPREDTGDEDVVIIGGAELDEHGNILNPEEYFKDDKPGAEHIYIGYSDEQIRMIENQRFLWWKGKDVLDAQTD